MKKTTIFTVLLGIFALPASSDPLVWKSGVRVETQEAWNGVDQKQPLASVTLVDSQDRLAAIQTRPGYMDWEKTRAAPVRRSTRPPQRCGGRKLLADGGSEREVATPVPAPAEEPPAEEPAAEEPPAEEPPAEEPPAEEPPAEEPPAEEPAAEGPEGVIATDLRGKKLYGNVFVMGTLRNNTSEPVTNIRLKARCIDRRGRTVRDAWGKPGIEVLMPRQKVDFEVKVRNVTYRFVDKYEVEVKYDVLEP